MDIPLGINNGSVWVKTPQTAAEGAAAGAAWKRWSGVEKPTTPGFAESSNDGIT
jgi:hypothetical protein